MASAQEFKTKETNSCAINSVREIFNRAEWFFFHADQDISRHQRRLGRRAACFDLQKNQSESLATEPGNTNWTNCHAKPRVAWSHGKKMADHITGNGQCQAACNHRVDADHSAAGIGQGPAGIAGSKPYTGLHPGLQAKAAHRTDRVNHTRGERSQETHRIADSDREFSGTQLSGIRRCCSGQIACIDAKRDKVAPWIASRHRSDKLAPVPELNVGIRIMGDMGVRHNRAITGPDHSGSAPASAGTNQYCQAPKMLCDLTKPCDGHVTPLRSGGHPPKWSRRARRLRERSSR